jgi:OmpA-OmpF porin, OOP family
MRPKHYLYIVATMALAAPVAAFADSASVTQTGAFIAVQGGRSSFDIDRNESSASHSITRDDSGAGFGVLGGYRWVVSRPLSLGVEAGYVNLGKTDWREESGGLGSRGRTREKTKSDAVVIGANGKWDLPEGFTVTARAGIAHIRTRYNAGELGYFLPNPPPEVSLEHASSTDNTLYGGVGFGYDFNENIGVTLTYDRYAFKAQGLADEGHTAHVGVTGINVEYRFW